MSSNSLNRMLWPSLVVVIGLGVAAAAWYAGASVHDDHARRALERGQPAAPPAAGVYGRIVLVVLAVTASVAAMVLAVFSRRVGKPLRRLEGAARALSYGRLDDADLPVTPVRIASLGQLLRSLARQTEQKVRDVSAKSNEVQAILASMVEGVVAVDAEQRVLTMNAAAERLLEVDARQAQGRGILEVIRNPRLQAFVGKAARSGGPIDDEVTIHTGRTDRLLQLQGSVLRDSEGAAVGAVVVLHDVSRIRQLETIRQEFVANVSHELKTPITAIKAAIETLMAEQGAVDVSERFLPIAARQSDRLSAIVDDLLTLARIEQQTERHQVQRARRAIRPIVESAVETCQAKAARRRMSLSLTVPGDLAAPINGPMLERAVVNLVDNAVKYGHEAAAVAISAATETGGVVIAVADSGPGIDQQHLPRLFERFYRPDKARSRDLGGTGLGLAIVKHVAQAHGGRVSVQSTPGEGSTFRVHLPA